MAAYGISAVRFAGSRIEALWMGLLDSPSDPRWIAEPSQTRLSEVIDRILAGDSVLAVVQGASGDWIAGPPAQIAIGAEDDETLAFPASSDGPTLEDLPRC